jgi:hypothetical protein
MAGIVISDSMISIIIIILLTRHQSIRSEWLKSDRAKDRLLERNIVENKQRLRIRLHKVTTAETESEAGKKWIIENYIACHK